MRFNRTYVTINAKISAWKNMKTRYRNTFEQLNNDTIRGFDRHGNEFLFDAEDYPEVTQYYWAVNNDGSVIGSIGNGVTVFMHRWLMKAPKGMVVDHINHNQHDNRKTNLRICTRKENTWNKSPISKKGNRIGIVQYRKKFLAHISVNGNHRSKMFATYEEALNQRIKWEQELFGEFAPYEEK